MNQQLRGQIRSILLSGAFAVPSGMLVALLNGFITNFFTSSHYRTAAQSQRYILGITLAYGILFAVVSFLQIWPRLSRQQLYLWYPLSGGVTLSVAWFLRNLSSTIGNLDCGHSCVDTMVPMAAQETATRVVGWVLLGLYVCGLLLYLYVWRRDR